MDGGDGDGGGGESAEGSIGPRRPETSAAESGGTRPSGRRRPCLQMTMPPRECCSYTSSPCVASGRMWTAHPGPPYPQIPAPRDSSHCENSGSVSSPSKYSCLHSNCGGHIWDACPNLVASSLTWLLRTLNTLRKKTECHVQQLYYKEEM